MRLTVKSKNQGQAGPLRIYGVPVSLLLSSLLYFLYFLGHGASFTSFSPHMLHRFGERAGFIFFAGQAAYPIGYLFAGWMSDATRRIRGPLVLTLALQAPVQYILFDPDLSFTGCIVMTAISRFFFATNSQLLSIAVLEKLNFQGFSVSRAAGTAGFLVVQITMLLLEVFAFATASPDVQGGREGQLGSIFFLLTASLAFVFPATRISRSEYFFRDAIIGIRRYGLILFFILSFLFHVAYQVVDNYLGGYLRQKGGMPFVYGGWAIAVLIEIPFMTFAERIVHRLGLRSLFLLAIGAGALRFFVLALDTMGAFTGPALAQQLFHGIHFTGFYMGTVYLLRRVFPGHLFGTGMGLYMVLAVSLGGACGSLLSRELMAGMPAENPFLWIFGGSAILHVAVFFGFLFLSPAGERNRSVGVPE